MLAEQIAEESYLCYESADQLIWLEQLCSHGALSQISDSVVGNLQVTSKCQQWVQLQVCNLVAGEKLPELQLKPAATDAAVQLSSHQVMTAGGEL